MIATAHPVVARTVTTDSDVESLRQIRNACRTFMTNDQSYIDEEKQRLWWAYHNPDDWAIWLLSVDSADVGYMFLRREGKRPGWYTGFGLLPEWRGKGIGKAGHVFLAAQKPGEQIVAKCLISNIPAHRVVAAGGFRFSHDEGDSRLFTVDGGTIGFVESEKAPIRTPDARTMPAGRAMDAFIAEEVLGWTDLSDHEGFVVAENGHLLGRPPRQAYLADVPEFSTSSAAALQVLARIPSLGFVGFALHDWPEDGDDERWCASFGKHGSPGDRYAEAVAPTAALAICRAALLAVRQ